MLNNKKPKEGAQRHEIKFSDFEVLKIKFLIRKKSSKVIAVKKSLFISWDTFSCCSRGWNLLITDERAGTTSWLSWNKIPELVSDLKIFSFYWFFIFFATFISICFSNATLRLQIMKQTVNPDELFTMDFGETITSTND